MPIPWSRGRNTTVRALLALFWPHIDPFLFEVGLADIGPRRRYAPGPHRSVRRRVEAVLAVLGKRPGVKRTSDLNIPVTAEWFRERLNLERRYSATLGMIEIMALLCDYAVYQGYARNSPFWGKGGPHGWFPREFKSGWPYPHRRRSDRPCYEADVSEPGAKPRPPRAKAAPRPFENFLTVTDFGGRAIPC